MMTLRFEEGMANERWVCRVVFCTVVALNLNSAVLKVDSTDSRIHPLLPLFAVILHTLANAKASHRALRCWAAPAAVDTSTAVTTIITTIIIVSINVSTKERRDFGDGQGLAAPSSSSSTCPFLQCFPCSHHVCVILLRLR
jgi:hypothetical protein